MAAESKQPLPVVLCGKTEQIATTVIETLKPEFEVIHLILTPDTGVAQIPLLLAGSKEAPSDSSLGTRNYSRPPVAVILGAGYDDVDTGKMMEACYNSSSQVQEAGEGKVKKVPWLRPDSSKPAPPLGPEYGKALVQRIKDTLAELNREGKMDRAEVVWY